MDQQVTDQTQGEGKNKNPEMPIPNILLLGAADSGKEAFVKQVCGRAFTRRCRSHRRSLSLSA